MLRFTLLASIVLFFSISGYPSEATTRKLASLVKEQPLVLKYHNGPLLKGSVAVNMVWYGNFTTGQRAVLVDFIQSLTSTKAPQPSVSTWWQTTAGYKGGKSDLVVGNQFFAFGYPFGKLLKTSQITTLSSLAVQNDDIPAINLVFTSADVAVDGFCMSICGSHGSGQTKTGKKFAYAWVGNSVSQCPGQCAWPFHQPIYGPQNPPLVAPNGDVGLDGMVINLATVLAGTVTNPFDNGYYQGPANAPLEAVSACTGIFGKGSYPGYPGDVSMEKTTGASYNANGVNGRKYLLPAMWDPATSACKTVA